ncbi:MAG: hypothetical protein LBV36_08975 [Chromatiales bacterium]|jgi:hypothetical protein|nr:hypothetical protein [Chromatiales bacterium]
MSARQKPVVGNWYMNMAGQLIKVWALGYTSGRLSRVVIEHLNGKRKILSLSDWWSLELEIHLYRTTRRKHNSSEELHR